MLDAVDRRAEQPVEEPALDVHGQRDAGGHPGEQRALHQRAARRRSRRTRRSTGSPAGDRAGGGAARDHGEQHERQQERRDQELRAAELHAQRATASAPTTRACMAGRGDASRSSELRLGLRFGRRVAGDREEDVVERRLLDLDRVDLDAGLVERADDRRDRACAVRRAQHAARRSRASVHVAERGEQRPSRRARSAGSSISSTWSVGSPTPRLERRRACPRRRSSRASMIPTRSASCSASSRYCVVRKTVVPSSLSTPHLAPQRGAARRVEARRRLVEEQHARARGRAPARGRAGGACRRSTCRGGGRRRRRARRARAARRRAPARLAAAQPVQRALQARAARGRSSAGRARPPGARRRSSGARRPRP